MSQPRYQEQDGGFSYRPMSMLAVLGFGLGLLSIAAIFVWFLFFLPLLGLLFSLLGLLSITRSQGEYTGRKLAVTGICLSLLTSGTAGAYQYSLYKNEVPPEYKRVSFVREISMIGLEKYSDGLVVPESIRELDGQKIFLKGFMFPTKETRNLTEFLMLKDSNQCCFGGNPQLQDMIAIRLSGERVVNYYPGMVCVGGIFRIKKDYEFGPLKPIYELDTDYVDVARTEW